MAHQATHLLMVLFVLCEGSADSLKYPKLCHIRKCQLQTQTHILNQM